MAIVFIDAPGEWYGANGAAIAVAASPWDVVTGTQTIRSGAGTTDRPYMDGFSGGLVQKNVTPDDDMMLMMSMKVPAVFAASIVARFQETGTVHVDLRTTATGTLNVTRNGTVLLTGTTVLALDGWYWIQLKVKIHNTTGEYELRINNVVEGAAATGQDTQNGGTATVNQIVLGASAAQRVHIRDIIIADGAGTAFRDHHRVRYSNASAAGTTTQWTPSAGSNYQNVDEREAAFTDDTDYNSEGTNGDIDLYATADLPTSAGSILAATIITRLRKDDAGAQTARRVVRVNSTNYEGGDLSLGDSYVTYQEILTTSPDTGVAWTEAEINALEVGVKKQA